MLRAASYDGCSWRFLRGGTQSGRSGRGRRAHGAPAVTEADGSEAVAAGVGAQQHLVPVLEVSALLAGGEPNRLLAASGGLEQATEAFLAWGRDGARSEQVARLQIAAVAGVVRHHLRHRPVHVARA